MADPEKMSSLLERGAVPVLTGPDNWDEWLRRLTIVMQINDYWGILSGTEKKPDESTYKDLDTKEYRKELRRWTTAQSKLAGLLSLYLDAHMLKTLDRYKGDKEIKDADWTATRQFEALKESVGAQGFIARGAIADIITEAKLNNYSSVKEYGDAIEDATLRLSKLGEPMPEWLISRCFLKGLPGSYQNWKDVTLAEFLKSPTDDKGKMRFPKVADMITALRSRDQQKDDGKSNFKALQTTSSSRQSGKKKDNKEKPTCSACQGPHSLDKCWVKNDKAWKDAPENFKEKYSSRSEALNDRRKINAEFQRGKKGKSKAKNKDEEDGDSKPVLFTKSLKTISNLDANWYADNAASYHITYDKSVFISSLDHTSIAFETVSGEVLTTQGAGVIRLPVRVGEVEDWVTISDVNYCSDATSNLLSIGKLVRKGCWYIGKEKKLELHRPDNDIAFEGTLTSDDVYVLSLHGDRRPKPSPVLLKTSQAVSKERAHRRMGHMYYGGFSDLLKNADGLSISPGSPSAPFCEACTLGKQTKSHSKEPATRAKDPGERWHADLVGGGQSLPSVGGAKYGIWFTDDATRKRWLRTMKTRDDIPEVVEDFFTFIENVYGYKCKKFRSDNELKSCEAIFKKRGILHEPSALYAQNQDGIAERTIRTILGRSRAMMIDSGLDQTFWAEILTAATYITDRTPTKALNGKTPLELFTGERPDLSNLRVYGCAAYCAEYSNRKKLENRSWKGILVGYEAKNQWRVWNPEKRKLFVRRDVVFNEDEIPAKEKADNKLKCQNLVDIFVVPEDRYEDDSSDSDDDSSDSDAHPRKLGTDSGDLDDLSGNQGNDSSDLGAHPENSGDNGRSSPPLDASNIPLPDDWDGEDSNEYDSDTIVVQQELPQPRRVEEAQADTSDEEEAPQSSRPRRNIARPDYKKLHTGKAGATIKETGIPVPKTWKEAVSGPYATQWKQASSEEFASLKERGTFKEVKLPKGRKALGGKWVYKVKNEQDGSKRFKGRYVVQGFRQKKGVDYDETYGAVIRAETQRILTATSVKLGWDIQHIDIVTAFLYSRLDHELYVKPPEGYELQSGKVWLLDRGLYGLKQGAYLWFENIKEFFITKCGLTQSRNDDGLFYNVRDQLYITIWVDDNTIYSGNKAAVQKLKDLMKQEYKIKELGTQIQYLEMEMTHYNDGSILLTQQRYINEMLSRFKMQSCSTTSTPVAEKALVKAPLGYEAPKPFIKAYMELVGSLMHLMTKTRPDLAYSVGRLSQFNANPTKEHYTQLKRVLRYVKGTRDYGIYFPKYADTGVDV